MKKLRCFLKSNKMTNNKKEKERQCLNSFLLHYNQINDYNYIEINAPDEDPNNPLNVDFLCEDTSKRKIIAIDILSFHHSEWMAQGDRLSHENIEAMQNELGGKVKGAFIALIPYNTFVPRNCAKIRKKIISVIIDETENMKLGEERNTKNGIWLHKYSDDESSVIFNRKPFVYSGPGAGLSELIENIKEKNLGQFREAKENGYETFLLIDDQRESLSAAHPGVLRDLNNGIDSILPQEICYIDYIFLRSRENKFYTLK